MGWGWVHALSKYHDLWVITEKDEFQADIEKELKNKPELRDAIHFYYISRERHHIWEKIWPPSYYWSYRKWQKEAYTLACSLHREIGFDLVHQLNMTGYREPGYLWKLPLPFIWGPIGGFMQMPWSFMSVLGWRSTVFYSARNIINSFQMRFSARVRKAINKANALIAATKEDKIAIKKIFNKESTLINETGVSLLQAKQSQPQYKKDRALKLCWCGLIIGRKALPLALHAISRLQKELCIEMDIIGDGPEQKRNAIMAKKLGIDSVIRWHGWISHKMAQQIISQSDMMLFTSLQEGTPHVILEALSFGVPVICHDICGFGTVVDETCGIKIPTVNPQKSIEGFTGAIRKLANNPALLNELSNDAFKKASGLTWEHKIDAVRTLYNKIAVNYT
jgi:glycosyltransferase involved in cell wall biosynthesis